MSEQTLDALRRLLTELLDSLGFCLDVPLQADTPLADLGLQSLHVMELGFRIAETFQIDLARLENPAVFATLETLADVIDAAQDDRPC
jgi:acyl carrier protein